MEKSNNNAVEIRYDADNNVTFEQLECGHIYYRHDLVNDRPEMIVSVAPNRHYEGKTPDNDAKIGYGFTVFVVSSSQNKPNLNHKIVFDIDDERLEVGAHPQSASLPESLEMFEKAMSKPIYTAIEFDLQPDDIKRFADARKIDMCLVSKDVYKVARGYNALDACTIEGMKGVMKRAYYHFVDRTCYVDYCKKRKKQETEANNNQQERQGTQQKRNRKEQGQSKQKDVEYKVNDDVIEIKYDGIKNITYEFLEKGVINADIGNPNLSVSDTIISITPMHYYEGKVLNDSAKIGFRITISGPEDYVSNFYYHIEKIVIVFDEERLEVEFGEKGSENTEEYAFSQTEIVGLNKTNVPTHVKYKHVWDEVWKDFVLQPADIKRIAEAHEVGMYIDAFTLLDANGGDISFRDGGGSFYIEGIQGTMKRAYHYFVDETCYEDYISIFAENKKKALKKEKQKIEAERKKQEQQRIQQEQQRILQEQAEQEEIARWCKKRNRSLIILVVSIVLFFVGASYDLFGLAMIAGLVGFAFLARLLRLYGYTGDGSNGNDNFEG